MILYITPNDDSVFDINKTGDYVTEFMDWNTDFNGISAKDKQKFENGLDSEITMMTASEYVRQCMNLHKVGYNQLINNSVNFDKVIQLTKEMLDGVTYSLPYINYLYKEAEGIHKVLAFAKAFGDEAIFPVLEIRKADVTDDEIYEYAEYICPDRADEKYIELAKVHGRTDEDINTYLNVYVSEPVDEEESLEMMNAVDFANNNDLDTMDLESYDVTFDYAQDIRTLCQKSGKTIEELSQLNSAQFNKLLDRFL